MRAALVSVSLGCILCIQMSAQTGTVSQISGAVHDPSGSAVPGATVTITNTSTSASRTAESSADGSYSIPNLPPGPYRLQATKEGFSTFNQTGIVLQVNTSPAIDVTLQVGAVSESVSVEANAAMLETHTNSVGQVIDQQRVVDLPLNGRNVAQLITLSGAAVTGTAGGLASNLNYPTAVAVAVAGSQPNATNYFLDGGTHIDPRTNVGLPLPFPDALQEFKVETSTLPANYGSHPGGAVNVVTKSGTNSFHGDVFEFVRNYHFNARNFFLPDRDRLKRNQFGGVLGGAVKKDKVFFFAGFQGTSERSSALTPTTAFVPTADVLNGDFSAILSSACRTPVTLTAASGAVGNVIPKSLLNPVALKIAALLPVASDPCGKVVYGVPSAYNEYQGTARVDWQRTQSDSVFVRYFITDYNLQANYQKGNLLSAAAPGLLDRVQTLTAGDTFVPNAAMVNSFRATFSRSAIQRVGAEGVPNLAELGSSVYSPIDNYMGQFQVNGYFNMNAIPGWVYTNIWTLSDDFSMIRGSHQMGLGVNWVHTQENATGVFQQNPRMTFTGTVSAGTPSTGNALADFMTGFAGTMLQGNGQVGRDVANLPSIYAQDNWKVTHRFQMNVGLRWDPFVPQHQLYDYASVFKLSDFYAGKTSSVFKNAPPGLTFPGDGGFPGRSNSFPRYGNFAPRFGFVLDPRGKGLETIRGGYGVFYESNFLWISSHVPLNPPWGETISINNVNLSNPWSTYPGGNPFPSGNPTANFVFPVPGVYVFVPEHVRSPYTQQWNLSIQKQIAADWLLAATYLGNKTTHQWLGQELNPAVFGPGATTGNTESRRLFIRANPATGKYYGSTIMVDDNGNASYNGLLLSANRRFSHYFSLLANYTWSHCFNQGDTSQDIINYYQDASNRRNEWGSCAADRTQVFNMSGVVQTPKLSKKWLQRVAGDWQVSPIFTRSSGAALNIVDGSDISLTGLGNDRPNVVGNAVSSNPTLNQWFNTSAFQRQPSGTFGNAGRNVLRGPGAWNLDLAISRNFPVRENMKFNIRWEMFNTFNHARFNGINSLGVNLNSANTFGVITTALDPRIMQVAGKLTF
jgi:hypothetical protein